MQTNHLCVLIHIIWTKGEVGALFNWLKPSSKIFLLTIPMRCFFCGSFILFLSCYAFMHSCMLMPCRHLLGKGWHLGSRLWWLNCDIVTFPLVCWVRCVLDCIHSWSLPSSMYQVPWSLPSFLLFWSEALAAILFSEVEPFMQLWKRASWGTFMWSYLQIWTSGSDVI